MDLTNALFALVGASTTAVVWYALWIGYYRAKLVTAVVGMTMRSCFEIYQAALVAATGQVPPDESRN